MFRMLLQCIAAVILGVSALVVYRTFVPTDIHTNAHATTTRDASQPLVHQDVIKIYNMSESAHITSPLTLYGEARGAWFFEGSFPVMLTDWDGKIIAQTVATAQSNWMTNEYVPFVAEIIFDTPTYGESGALVFKKDNPSGLPEHDDAFEIKILFQ